MTVKFLLRTYEKGKQRFQKPMELVTPEAMHALINLRFDAMDDGDREASLTDYQTALKTLKAYPAQLRDLQKHNTHTVTASFGGKDVTYFVDVIASK